ncbi:homeobox protein HMX1-like [Cynocephalus volans]|uniref:homeobox protein HMX1-like n=1 Tax=Cynocephalus volans TaxID=110931 RepID=UPI002FCA1F57
MPEELTEPGRATPARASSFLIENLLAAEAKGAGRAARGDGGREDEEDDADEREDADAEPARRRRLQRRRQPRAGTGPGGEARARALLGPGALGLGPRPPPGPGPPYALGCGGAPRWCPRAHGGYGGGLSPDSELGRAGVGRARALADRGSSPPCGERVCVVRAPTEPRSGRAWRSTVRDRGPTGTGRPQGCCLLADLPFGGNLLDDQEATPPTPLCQPPPPPTPNAQTL